MFFVFFLKKGTSIMLGWFNNHVQPCSFCLLLVMFMTIKLQPNKSTEDILDEDIFYSGLEDSPVKPADCSDLPPQECALNYFNSKSAIDVIILTIQTSTVLLSLYSVFMFSLMGTSILHLSSYSLSLSLLDQIQLYYH